MSVEVLGFSLPSIIEKRNTAWDRANAKWLGSTVVSNSVTVGDKCYLGLSDPTDERGQRSYVLGYD